MVDQASLHAFLTHLDQKRAEKGDAFSPQDLEKLLAELHEDHFQLIYQAVNSIAGNIKAAKIALTHSPSKVTGEKIPDANQELETVVQSTEEAANQIMDSAEAIQELASTLDSEQEEALVAHVTTIFEASNFQDLTGQRIRKVITHLKEIDTTITELLNAISDKIDIETIPTKESKDTEKALMNGPQTQGNTPSQEDIDKLFDSF